MFLMILLISKHNTLDIKNRVMNQKWTVCDDDKRVGPNKLYMFVTAYFVSMATNSNHLLRENLW